MSVGAKAVVKHYIGHGNYRFLAISGVMREVR